MAGCGVLRKIKEGESNGKYLENGIETGIYGFVKIRGLGLGRHISQH